MNSSSRAVRSSYTRRETLSSQSRVELALSTLLYDRHAVDVWVQALEPLTRTFTCVYSRCSTRQRKRLKDREDV